MAGLTEELSVLCDNSSANCYRVRAAFDLETFEGVIVQIHLVSLSGDFAAVGRVVDDQVGISAQLNRAFAREEAEDFGRVRARRRDELMQVDPATIDAVGVVEVDAVFETRNAIRDLGEIIAPHEFLGREIEGRVIGREG